MNWQTAFPVDKERWLSSSEAARLAAISLSYVSELARRGVWPSVRYRSVRYIDRPAFEDWLQQRRQIEEQLR